MQLTVNQQCVLAILQQSPHALSAYALLDLLRDKGISAPSQVYRALQRLSAYGLVHRLESLNAYVPCNQAEGPCSTARAFSICDDCGGVEEFVDSDVGHYLSQRTRDIAFAINHSTIELHGRCATCSKLGQEEVVFASRLESDQASTNLL